MMSKCVGASLAMLQSGRVSWWIILIDGNDLPKAFATRFAPLERGDIMQLSYTGAVHETGSLGALNSCCC
jgi:hypothetical protein